VDTIFKLLPTVKIGQWPPRTAITRSLARTGRGGASYGEQFARTGSRVFFSENVRFMSSSRECRVATIRLEEALAASTSPLETDRNHFLKRGRYWPGIIRHSNRRARDIARSDFSSARFGFWVTSSPLAHPGRPLGPRVALGAIRFIHFVVDRLGRTLLPCESRDDVTRFTKLAGSKLACVSRCSACGSLLLPLD
jgi:hypothetical protein